MSASPAAVASPPAATLPVSLPSTAARQNATMVAVPTPGSQEDKHGRPMQRAELGVYLHNMRRSPGPAAPSGAHQLAAGAAQAQEPSTSKNQAQEPGVTSGAKRRREEGDDASTGTVGKRRHAADCDSEPTGSGACQLCFGASDGCTQQGSHPGGFPWPRLTRGGPVAAVASAARCDDELGATRRFVLAGVCVWF